MTDTVRSPATRGGALRRALRIRPRFLLALALPLGPVSWLMLAMPGRSFRGALPAPTPRELALEPELRADVDALAREIGARSLGAAPEGLERAALYIEAELLAAGYAPRRQAYLCGGSEVRNIEATCPGGASAGEIVVVGAHYDGFFDSPAANDNASGVAATLALARRFAGAAPARTLRFVFFVNEEPPWFGTERMGSRVYAGACRARDENIVHMWSLETLGRYVDEGDSQAYPLPVLALAYPDRGNYVAFVGNLSSRAELHDALSRFRRAAPFPSEGAALLSWIPGVAWSDHASFWSAGYPALLITDTALFRDEHYHTTEDIPERVDTQRLARVVRGLETVLAELAR